MSIAVLSALADAIGGVMKTGYYFLLLIAALAASSASHAANTLRLKEAPKSVMQSTSHLQPTALKKKTPPPVVKQDKPAAAASVKQKPPANPNPGAPAKPSAKPPQVVKPPQARKPPQAPKPPPPPSKSTQSDLYFPPIKDTPGTSVDVPEPGTAGLFITALGLLLMFRRSRRPARSAV
jgi:outer membrane biosynthesis protein TonB